MTINRPKVFCPYCGERTQMRFLEGTERAFCLACETTLYENPVPATCVVVQNQNRILLVKRRFPPKMGEWCLPGGFMELKEQPADGALRELKEETGLTGRVKRFLGAIATPGAIYSGLLILGYNIEVSDYASLTPGDDASEVGWFAPDNFPVIAFDSHAEFIRRVLENDMSPSMN